jgi:hypothetical protein
MTGFLSWTCAIFRGERRENRASTRNAEPRVGHGAPIEPSKMLVNANKLDKSFGRVAPNSATIAPQAVKRFIPYLVREEQQRAGAVRNPIDD